MFICIVFAFFISMGIFAVCYSNHLSRKRVEQLQAVASDLGLEYRDNGSKLLMKQLEKFELKFVDNRKKIANVISGETDNVSISIFDLQFSVGKSQQSQRHTQTTVILGSPQLSLPKFELRTEIFLDKMFGKMLDHQDIDFESHPDFSKKFVLAGDEAAVRDLFQPHILEFFEGKNDVFVEGAGDEIVFYRFGKKVNPDSIKSLFAEVYELYGVFSESSKVALA